MFFKGWNMFGVFTIRQFDDTAFDKGVVAIVIKKLDAGKMDMRWFWFLVIPPVLS